MKQDLAWNFLRGEVLRQLIGSLTQWMFVVLVTFVILTSLRYIATLIAEGKFQSTSRAFLDLFSVGLLDNDEDTKKTYFITRRWAKTAIVFFAGYLLSYNINVAYVTGDISLIVTTARITYWFMLVYWLLQATIFFAYLLLLTAIAKLKVNHPNGLTNDVKGFKLVKRCSALLKTLSYLLMVVVPLVSILLVYLNLAK